MAHAIGADVGRVAAAAGGWDLLVNATPVGSVARCAATSPFAGPFDGRLVYDLVYNPDPTALDACRASAPAVATIGGLEMLVAQAGRQFEWWTGQRPPGWSRAARGGRDGPAAERL